MDNVQNVQTGKSIVVFEISNFLKRHLMISAKGSSEKYLKTFLFILENLFLIRIHGSSALSARHRDEPEKRRKFGGSINLVR